MSQYLRLKKSNCKNCYKCIRNCPVKSIRFSDGQAHIIGEECILCGQCFVVCPQNAKEIRNDVGKAQALIQSRTPVYASVAPSFVANYEGVTIGSMEKALRKLGFTAVEETAIGATMVKQCYDRIVNEEQMDVILSSCCHTVNMLLQKHYPEALPYLAPVQSPMEAHCAGIKRAHPEAKTVFIGPCISKKEEAESFPGVVDCVLTFEELTGWLETEGISFEPVPDDNRESKARLFPTNGGVLRTMARENPNYSYLTVDGIENCKQAVEDILAGNLHHCFIEMSACPGSCIGGPVMERGRRAPVRDFAAVDRYAGDRDFKVETPTPEQIHQEYPVQIIRRDMPGSKAIEELLRQMGKQSPDQELNCGSCGYNTCREKAIAVFQGKADLSMCLPFLKEKAESFSDTIINNTPNGIVVLNEDLEVQQINKAACGILNIKRASDVVGEQVVRILDPQVFFEVMQTGRGIHGQRVYLAEYQKYAEQTVIYDQSYHIVMCILRDVTEEEAVRATKEEISRQTVDITDKVIDKQMRVVQEIASLLGETTAETKIALTKLKESLRNE